MTRSRRRGFGGFLSSIFSNRTESLVGEDRWRRNEWKRALIGTVILALGIAIVEGMAVSMGGSNEFVECFCWGAVVEGGSGAVVELVGDGVEVWLVAGDGGSFG